MAPSALPVHFLVEEAVRILINGHRASARDLLASIPFQALVDAHCSERKRIWGRGGPGDGLKSAVPRPHRPSIPDSTKLEVFIRDAFACRYSHCQRKTISLPVLGILTTTFPDLIPNAPGWSPEEQHALYLTHSTSLEHYLPLAQGGSNDLGNLVTSCYGCNDLKGSLTAEALGWSLTLGPSEEWDGLVSYLPMLLGSRA